MNRAQRLERDGVTEDDIITFYGQRNANGWMSSFAPYAIQLPNPWSGELEAYLTREHRYQAMKAASEEEHRWVMQARRPSEAKDRGRSVTLREGWGDDYGDLCWYVMQESIFAMVYQHEEVMRWLMATEGKMLYEDSPTDDIWGWRYATDHSGKNLLGECWLFVREMVG